VIGLFVGGVMLFVAMLLTIPFLLILGVLAAVVVGAGLLAALSPLLVVAALVAIPIWLMRRRSATHRATV
jgi:hypothetical protein